MERTDFPVKKSLGLLIDPDKVTGDSLKDILRIASESKTDYILAGGSLTFNDIGNLIGEIKKHCTIPVVLFPGNLLQLSDKADIILLLSPISGRNPELLIGTHVIAAPYLMNMKKKLVATGYILVGCGPKTSVEYMSQTVSIPSDKPDLVVATALAGEMLGLGMIYLEGGSGASTIVPPGIISAVKKSVSVPVAVGGGIKSKSDVEKVYAAGADLVIVGNGCEKNAGLLAEACAIRDKFRSIG